MRIDFQMILMWFIPMPDAATDKARLPMCSLSSGNRKLKRGRSAELPWDI